MKNLWSDQEARNWIKNFGHSFGKEVALQAYASRLLGSDTDLVLYGGGNTSIKQTIKGLLGESLKALFVKASGLDMASMQDPTGMVSLRLDGLLRMRKLRSSSDEAMMDYFKLSLARPHERLPSIETSMHAFLPPRCIAHTHPAAILALTNRRDARRILRCAFGDSVATVPYVRAGLALAHAVERTYRKNAHTKAIILMQHGLVTWGKTPKEAYEKTCQIVECAEQFLMKHVGHNIAGSSIGPALEEARNRYIQTVPLLRGLLCPQGADDDKSPQRIILKPLLDKDTLRLLSCARGKSLALSAPLTPDYLIRTKAVALWLDNPQWDKPQTLPGQMIQALSAYQEATQRHVRQHLGRDAKRLENIDNRPRVIFVPGMGVACAGKTPFDATLAQDITSQALRVKTQIHETGGEYLAPPVDHLLDMEFRAMQQAKVSRNHDANRPLAGSIAIVTGAAGAIGSGICRGLLQAGCAVAATDLADHVLETCVAAWQKDYRAQVIAVPMDVTDAKSVARGFDETIVEYGGIDLVIANAGAAHVSTLAELGMDDFKALERVNVEGTLLVLREAARRFKLQAMGGDIVLISTKNVFAPGVSFGAYSATKAAAHQLARIASLELAEIGVRVNMVAPDAVFSNGHTKSGLWAKVGPDRMKARGLDEKGLEEYYRNRNLLKARVTADHVARAVLFFATRQTPTTGATLPVDGGLPEATPR